jgi:hypothetical protein
MNTDWAERRIAERRAEQFEYEATRDAQQWREHFDKCGDRDPCPHTGF